MSTMSHTPEKQTNWRRRISLAIVTIITIILGYAYLYQWALWVFVGESISYIQAIQVVIEVLTTAGFGGDTTMWRQSDALAGLVILMNISGVLLVFLAIPLFAVPLFQQAFQTQPSTATTLEDHVILCGWGPQEEVLRDELDAATIPYLFIHPDPEVVIRLNESGVEAIVGNPENVDTLRAANASAARALIADIDDETNPTVILSAKQVDPTLRTISVIRNYEAEPFHRYAGADEVVLARQIIGRSLGLRAAGSYAEKLQETIEAGNGITVTELLVEKGSDLVGQSFRESPVFDREGLTVIGAWLGGKFFVTPDPDMVIQENELLLVVGDHEAFEDLKTREIPTHPREDRRILVGGYGTVGRTIVETLEAEGIKSEIIDKRAKERVDVIGDLTEPATFIEANVEQASAVALSLDEDIPTIYATLILNELAPDVEIIARADDDETVQKLYNAGADFVISLSTVTGEILASLVLEEVEIVTPDSDFGFDRSIATSLDGQTLRELNLRQETGCSIVAVERDDELLTEIGADFTIEENDVLIVAGTKAARRRFSEFVDRRQFE